MLLANIDMSDAHALPLNLFDLANATLVSTYPPAPRNKMPSIWFLRTLERTMAMCPSGLLTGRMLEVVQEGVARWVEDAHVTFDKEEYEMDVLPLYETVTVGLMSLPRTADTVEKFSAVLGSGFIGRENKPEVVRATFLDLWNSRFSEVVQPEEGWSEVISTCLKSVGLHKEATMQDTSEEQDNEEVEAQLVDLPSSDDYVFSPEIPSPRALELAHPFVLYDPDSPFVEPHTPRRAEVDLPGFPSTPKSTGYPTTPHRLRKSSSPSRASFPLLLSPKTPVRVPSTPKRHTPGPFRSLASPHKADKENASPLRAIASITERIAMRSPVASLPSTPGKALGKRPLDMYDEEEDDEVEMRVNKKSRHDVSHIFGDAFARETPVGSPSRRDSEALLNVYRVSVEPSNSELPASLRNLPSLPGSPSRSSSKRSPTHAAALKTKVGRRKGVFLDCVEVPTWKSLRAKKTAAAKFASLRPSLSLPSSLTHENTDRTLRRSSSTSRLSVMAMPLKRSYSLPEKTDVDSDGEIDYLPSDDGPVTRAYSASLRDLREMEMMHSGMFNHKRLPGSTNASAQMTP